MASDGVDRALVVLRAGSFLNSRSYSAECQTPQQATYHTYLPVDRSTFIFQLGTLSICPLCTKEHFNYLNWTNPYSLTSCCSSHQLQVFHSQRQLNISSEIAPDNRSHPPQHLRQPVNDRPPQHLLFSTPSTEQLLTTSPSKR